MPIYVSKPEIDIREKLNELSKPAGQAGQAMLRAETPQEQFNLINAGRKNLLINGDFRISQHAMGAVTKVGNGYGKYLNLDRWSVYYDGTTIEQSSAVINKTYKNTMKLTAVGNNSLYVYQMIEQGATLLSGKTLTLSFWVRGSKSMRGNGDNNVRSYQEGYINAIHRFGDFDEYQVTTEWQYVTRTFSLQEDTGTDRHLFILLDCVNDTVSPGDWVEYADVQLEVGNIATPFEHRHIAEELALCQRYAVRLGSNPNDADTEYNVIGTGWWRNTTSVLFNLQILAAMPVTLRHAVPTVKVYGANEYYVQAGSQTGVASFYGVNASGSSQNYVWLDFTCTTAAATNGMAAAVASRNAVGATYINGIVIDCEL